jgi:hypothetical protein
VINDGNDASPCPAEFPSEVHADQHTDLDEGSPSCTCECGDVVGASCGSATLREEGNFCAVFIPDPDTWPLSPGSCTFVSAPAGDYSVNAPSLQTGGASSSPQASESIPTPTFARDIRSCGTAAGDACDDGTCLPETPAEHSLCIFTTGETACPAGPWSTSVVTWSDVEDDRDCSSCTCGSPSGTCGGSVVLTNTGCGGGSVFIDEIPAGGCGDVSAFSHATWTPEVDASCAPSGGALQGDVTPTGAITYCCL